MAFSPDVEERIRASGADVLLSDSLATGESDFSFLQRLTQANPDLQVVLIGMKDDEATFLRAVCSGVAGYVLEDAPAMDVLAAVRAVQRGEAFCPPRLARVLFQYVAGQAQRPNVQFRLQYGLTRREQQLLPLIAEGLTNKEIAQHLNLSEQTIKNHIHRMLRKAGAPDRLSIVELCYAAGKRRENIA